MSSLVIDAENLKKNYGHVEALSGLNLHVAPGEVHGFLGPNGAGKSTTIKAIMGTIKLNSGKFEVLGDNPWKNPEKLHQSIAYVPGEVTVWPNLTGGEIIDFLSNMRGGIPQRRIDELITKFEFDPTKKARSYSRGNKQKIALIAALATNAKLFVFDEPTSGLDPVMEHVFQDEVLNKQLEGATVLLSSHILEEVAALCDKITIIKDGKDIEVINNPHEQLSNEELQEKFLTHYLSDE
ncbi:MAG: ABC transporter ATP-binding protein [Micrococcaceae bacterium]